MEENTSGNRMLTGMFRDRDSAEGAYNALSSRGYAHDDINLMMSEEAKKKHFSDEHETAMSHQALEGAAKGSAIGGTVGAIAAAVAAIGTSLVIPGLGLIVTGPIAAGLAGAGAGGLTGGVIGALVGNGIPEDRAKTYEKGMKEGHIVMGVRPRNDDDAETIRTEWQRVQGQEIHY